MKARKVKRLEPDGPLAENARRIVRVRVDELYRFSGAVSDPSDVKALHDMRIAAKRLRYVLELTAPCFPPEARRAARRAKSLQSTLGDIHDCDELLPLVEEQVERLRDQDAAAVLARAGNGAEDLDPRAVRAAPNRTRHRGLESLHAYLRARRDLLYRRFMREWSEVEESGLRRELEKALA